VAIALHCNLRPPYSTLVLLRFNYDSHAKFEVVQPVVATLNDFHCWYLTLRYDLDLWTLTLNIYNISGYYWLWLVKPCTKIERNWAIRSGVIAISVFDLMTLNLRVVLGSGIISIKTNSVNLPFVTYSVFSLLISYAVTLTFHPLTLNVCSTLRARVYGLY